MLHCLEGHKLTCSLQVETVMRQRTLLRSATPIYLTDADNLQRLSSICLQGYGQLQDMAHQQRAQGLTRPADLNTLRPSPHDHKIDAYTSPESSTTRLDQTPSYFHPSDSQVLNSSVTTMSSKRSREDSSSFSQISRTHNGNHAGSTLKRLKND